MWVSPNHPNPPRPYSPPQESGQRLATFPRHGGEELRVNLAEYEGHPYVSLRVWAPGPDGQLLPVKGKGLSVKLREVAGLAEVLGQLAADLPQQGPGHALPVERRQPDRPAAGRLGHPGKSRGQPNLSTNSRGKRGTERGGPRRLPQRHGEGPCVRLRALRPSRRPFSLQRGWMRPVAGRFRRRCAPSPTSARRGLGRGLPFGQLRDALVTQLEAFL